MTEEISGNEMVEPQGDTPPVAQVVEALCFTLNRPIGVTEVARLLGIRSDVVRASLPEVVDHLHPTGVMLQVDHDKFQIVTRPIVAEIMQRVLLPERPARLTKSSLETLAIIAYRQPITKGDIEYLRGVDCEAVLDTLERRGLVTVLGQSSAPGQPRLWGTTLEFLRLLGLERIEELPPLPRDVVALYEEHQQLIAADEPEPEAKRAAAVQEECDLAIQHGERSPETSST